MKMKALLPLHSFTAIRQLMMPMSSPTVTVVPTQIKYTLFSRYASTATQPPQPIPPAIRKLLIQKSLQHAQQGQQPVQPIQHIQPQSTPQITQGSSSGGVSKAQAVEQAGLTGGKPKASFLANVTSNSFMAIDGIIGLFRNSQLSMELWARYMQDSQKVSTRHQIMHVQRNMRDLSVIFPAVFIIGLPFKKQIFPIFFRHVPSLIPTSFYTEIMLDIKKDAIEKKREPLATKSLSDISAELSKVNTKDRSTHSQLTILRNMVSKPETASYADLAAVYPLVRDHLSITSAPDSLVKRWAYHLGFAFPFLATRGRLLRWADWMLKDDRLIRKEGVHALNLTELIEAMDDRGHIRLASDNETTLRNHLAMHIKFTQLLCDSALRTRVNIPEPAEKVYLTSGYTHVLYPEEIAAIGALVVMAESMKVTRWDQ